jgi:hypothetical protein
MRRAADSRKRAALVANSVNAVRLGRDRRLLHQRRVRAGAPLHRRGLPWRRPVRAARGSHEARRPHRHGRDPLSPTVRAAGRALGFAELSNVKTDRNLLAGLFIEVAKCLNQDIGSKGKAGAEPPHS